MSDERDDAAAPDPPASPPAEGATPDAANAPPTLASLARRQESTPSAAQPSGTPPAPDRTAPSPRPTPPAPSRQGPPPPPPAPRSSPPPPAAPPGEPAAPPSFAPPPAAPAASGAPAAPAPLHDDDLSAILDRLDQAPPTADAATPPPPAPTPPAPAPTPPPPAPAAEPPGQTAPEREDLSAILDQLHDDIDIAPSPAPKQPGDQLTDPRDLERPTDRNKIVVESTGGIDFRPTFATFGQRALGFVVDWFVLSLCTAPGVAVAVVGGSGAAIGGGIALALLGFVAAMIWYGRSVARTAQWFGNRVSGTRVVDVRNGQHVPASDAATRFAIRHLVSVVFFFGFLMALGDSQRRTFHDRFAGTIVVTRERETWTAGDD